MKPNLPGITILAPVGNGAGSVVFRAKDDRTGRVLAVKSVTPEVVREIQKSAPPGESLGDPQKTIAVYLAQVRNEWRIGHRLTHLAGGHMGIPEMHRLYVIRRLFLLPTGMHLVMDFVEGENLRRQPERPIADMVHVYRQAADILRFMHQHDVIHADMKPHHIIVDAGGRVQLLDLGLACHRGGHTAQVAGSPDYMAPEQLAGAGVDEPTDVFGLGATMFWALTGHTIRPNVTGASSLGAMDLQLKSFERSVRDYNPAVPAALEDIVLRSCAPSRKARLTLPDVIQRLARLI